MKIEIEGLCNRTIKERFIEDVCTPCDNSNVRMRFIVNVFRKVAKIESELNKDVSTFSFDEIVCFYKMCGFPTTQQLANMNSVLKNYTKFCYEQNMTNDVVNHFSEIDINVMKTCVNKKMLENKIITYGQLVEWEESLTNESDKFLLECLFCGIYGKQFSEITNATLKSFEDKNMFVMSDEKVIKTTKRLYDLARYAKSEDEYFTYKFDKNGSMKSFRLIESDKIIRFHIEVDYKNDEAIRQRMYRRFTTIAEYAGYGNLTINDIMTSGMIYWIRNRAKELNITPVEYMSNYHTEIEYQFGKTMPRTVLLNNYGKLFEGDKKDA